jgi:hypothetical protein
VALCHGVLDAVSADGLYGCERFHPQNFARAAPSWPPRHAQGGQPAIASPRPLWWQWRGASGSSLDTGAADSLTITSSNRASMKAIGRSVVDGNPQPTTQRARRDWSSSECRPPTTWYSPGSTSPSQRRTQRRPSAAHRQLPLVPDAPTVETERNARSSPRITRVRPVTVNVALDRMSLELLPALTSTGPGSMTKSPESPV